MSNKTRPRYCLQCDDGTVLEHRAKDVFGNIDGVAYSVEKISGWHCPACGEIEFDAGEGQRYNAALEAARQKAVELRAHAVRAARKKLKLSQAEAGKLFGGGATAFSEYESGKTQPHKSTVLLLRLLDNHPELLGELR